MSEIIKVIHERTLPVIASEILFIESQVARTALEGAIQIGIKLREAKEKVEFGQWENWCLENLNYSKSKTEKLMKIASEYGDENSVFSKTYTCTDLSVSKALRLLQVPEDKVEKFAEENDVTEMSVRELEKKIKELKQEKADEKSSFEKEKLALENEIEKIKSEVPDTSELDEQIEKFKSNLAEAAEREEKLKDEIKREEEKHKKAITDLIEEEKKKLAAQAESDAAEKINEAEKAADEARNEAAKEKERLEAQIEKLEAKVASATSEAVILFKVKADQLQKVFGECLEAANSTPDPVKYTAALEKLMVQMIARC